MIRSCLVLWASLGLPLVACGAAPPRATELRYVRPAGEGFALESLVRESGIPGGLRYTSRTERVGETMTLAVEFGPGHRVRKAEAVQQKKEKLTVTVAFDGTGATLTRQGKSERLGVPADVVVTTAPDWSDIFWVVRRYDARRGGKQTFAGLWIHPVQPPRKLDFTVEPEKGAVIEVGGRQRALRRYRVTLRSGAYLVWADADGRVIRLMPPGRPANAVILAGYESATAGLR